MTETDELRGGLRELGVQYQACGDIFTMWKHDGKTATYTEYPEGGKLKAFVTPAQAVAATVGRGTCEADETETIKCWVKCKDEPSTERMELIHVMECSECGHTYEHVNGDYEFCPRCGRKRVDA